MHHDEVSFIKSQTAAASSVNSMHVAKYYATFEFPEFIYMVWELCETNLKAYILKKGSIKEIKVGRIASQIVKAVLEIEPYDCIFDNMNPFSILKKDGIWKIACFTKK